MPKNFNYIGLIKLTLPDAKVIHCKRDPMDNCLSIFKTYFTGDHEYSHDLGELGRYYTIYRGIMEHWHNVMPGFIHDVHYEEIVADRAGQTRLLLKHCGLEWDDACLEFYKTPRAVMTASAEQVRRPIYKDSVCLWKRYEKALVRSLGKNPANSPPQHHGNKFSAGTREGDLDKVSDNLAALRHLSEILDAYQD